MTKVAKHKPMIVRGRRTNSRLVPAPVWNFQSKSSSRHEKGSCRLFFMYAEAFNRDEVDRWAHEEAERRSDADGTKEPGGLNLVCEVNTSIHQFQARELWLRLN